MSLESVKKTTILLDCFTFMSNHEKNKNVSIQTPLLQTKFNCKIWFNCLWSKKINHFRHYSRKQFILAWAMTCHWTNTIY